jgi:hypothetical protein
VALIATLGGQIQTTDPELTRRLELLRVSGWFRARERASWNES